MSRKTSLPTGFLTVAAAAWALASVLPGRVAAQGSSWDRYRVLVDRNIFLRDRASGRYRGPSAPTTAPVRDSDRSIVLTGIGWRDGEILAFFEDTRTETTTRIAIGQPVGKGVVRAITLDTVEYEREGTLSRIDVGSALQGGRFVRETVARSPPATSQPSSAPAPTTEPTEVSSQPAPEEASPPLASPASGGDESDILRQMRQRREQELRR